MIASNLLCRLPKPRKFLRDVESVMCKKGLLILVSPYSWLEEYTPASEWIGGTDEEESFTVLKPFMEEELGYFKLLHEEDIPFIIREHERKYQLGFSHATVWLKST